jgi:hypothetical protein
MKTLSQTMQLSLEARLAEAEAWTEHRCGDSTGTDTEWSHQSLIGPYL